MFLKINWHFAGIESAPSAIKTIVQCVGFAACALQLMACTPTFNWREVSLEQAGTSSAVSALLPCKPDRGTRAVQLAGQSVQMSMAGCEAGGAMFTVAFVKVQQAAQLQAVATDWKSSNPATHSRQLMHGNVVAQVAVYGQPKEGRDGPGALSSQAVETFLSNLKLEGAR
ncbi:MAG: hypothetical protein HC765_04135 [Brachymonas sp.]|nr:hypothetical protein [Brachymonas sp.]